MALDFENSTSVTVGETTITKTPFAIGVSDGAVLRGFHYSNDNPTKSSNKLPLLCLPSDLGNATEFEQFAVQLMGEPNGPTQVYTPSLRGRGSSDWTGIETYSPLLAAEDLISVCDALGLHHIAVVANGSGVVPALLMAPKRPSLISKLVLNDGAPEFDGVGIARLRTLSKNHPRAKTLGEAIKREKNMLAQMFPALVQNDWIEKVSPFWKNEKEQAHDSTLVGTFDAVGYEDKQPTLWKEFGIVANRPMMVIRGEHSPLVTPEILSKMERVSPSLVEIFALGQGHFPLLTKDDLPKKIAPFLAH